MRTVKCRKGGCYFGLLGVESDLRATPQRSIEELELHD